jgi:hypothetical protein
VFLLYWSLGTLRAVVPRPFRALLLTEVDLRVIGLALLVAMLTAILGGMFPAWRASRTTLMTSMRRATGSRGEGGRRTAVSTVLGFEAAASVVLLLGAAMAIRSFVGLALTDPGFVPNHLYTMTLPPEKGATAADRLAQVNAAIEFTRTQPGARAAAVDIMFAAGARPMTGIQVPPRTSIGIWKVTDDFLETVGARLLAGRAFTADDVRSPDDLAIVTPATVAVLWPGTLPAGAIGRQIDGDSRTTARRVVGVIDDIRESPSRPPAPMIFAPMRSADTRHVDLVFRADSPSNVAAIQMALADRFGGTVRPAGTALSTSLEQPRAQALMFGVFGVIGVLVAALGLFAVTSFEVAMRRYELGVRVALGATTSAIARMLIGRALRPVVAGGLAGLLVSYWLARWMESLVYGVTATDVASYAIVMITMAVSSSIAAWLPARRAAFVDPATTLRAQ